MSNFDAVASVGCSASRLYKSLETHTDWKTCSFHFFGTFAYFQKRSSYFKTGMVREILRVISSPGSTRLAISVPRYVVSSTFFKGVPSRNVILLLLLNEMYVHLSLFSFKSYYSDSSSI